MKDDSQAWSKKVSFVKKYTGFNNLSSENNFSYYFYSVQLF